MKNLGALCVVVGVAIWFGGEMFIRPHNVMGLPILVVGAVLYFVGHKKPG